MTAPEECERPNARPTSGYAMGCRCPRCRQGAAEYDRAWHAAVMDDDQRRAHLREKQRAAYRARRARGLPR